MSDTFDLTAFIDGSSYPRKSVVVYTDVAALKERQDLQNVLQGLDPKTGEELETPATTEQLEAAQNRLDELTPVIEDSGVTFELQGMPFRMAQEIADIFSEETPATEEEILKLVRTCIQSVTNVKGAKASVPDENGLKNLQLRLSPGEFTKLINAAIEVNFTAASYEAEIDAGFPGGSPDVG